jgi:hypothetical protein
MGNLENTLHRVRFISENAYRGKVISRFRKRDKYDWKTKIRGIDYK